MGLFDGPIDKAAQELKEVAEPLFTEFQNRLEKIAADTLDRIDGAVITFDITIRLPKNALPAGTANSTDRK